MGRELKRVPLDFSWPIGRIWHGYINPFYKKHSRSCPHCEGYGESPEVRLLSKKWHGSAPFDPAEKGSIPFTPEHPNVRKLAERNVLNSPSYYGRGEEVIQREAQRLCSMFNAQWAHHLSQEDAQVVGTRTGSCLGAICATRKLAAGCAIQMPRYQPPKWKHINRQHDTFLLQHMICGHTIHKKSDQMAWHCAATLASLVLVKSYAHVGLT